MTRITASQTQWAAGQGGFETGCVEASGGLEFHTVYDCGARPGREHALREVHEYAERRGATLSRRKRIDALYVSHFDEDHVNAIPELVKYFTFGRVVLPLLSPTARLLSLARTDDDSDWYLNLITDPSGALGDITGADSVIVVEPGLDLGALGVGELSDEGDGLEESVALAHSPTNRDPRATFGRESDTPRDALWEITPWVPHADDVADALFLEALVAQFSAATAAEARQGLEDPERFARGIADARWRASVRSAYKVASDALGRAGTPSNRTSMYLYSGPVTNAPRYRSYMSRNGVVRYSNRAEVQPWTPRPGWLACGDSRLSDPRTLEAFVGSFSGVLRHVGTMVLPHHGSDLDFSGAVLETRDLQPGALVANCGSMNRHGHPGIRTLFDIAAKGFHAVIVSEHANSRWSTSTIVDFRP